MAKQRPPVTPDPTPEEIESRCKEIQNTWDEETRISRIFDPSLLPQTYSWTPPIISVADLPVDIFNTDEQGEYPDQFDFSQSLMDEGDIDAIEHDAFEEYLEERKKE